MPACSATIPPDITDAVSTGISCPRRDEPRGGSGGYGVTPVLLPDHGSYVAR